MQRQTVDYGIDLGTTNSVIARATRNGVETIRNDRDEELTPSAVAVDADGDLLVGGDALNQAEPPPARAFKRLMGTDQRIAVGPREFLPEELSAEVLKALKQAAQVRYGEAPRQVVVTIPAMFLQPQCEATHRAATLAGLEAVALIQEPIAAATAFLGSDAAEGCYLVFDLGGGTFDASVVRLRGRQLTVLGHGGDSFLGGSDWDRLLAEWVLGQLEPSCGRLPRLRDGAGAYRLRRACEDVRKRLTTREVASIDLSELQVEPPTLKIRRSTFEAVVADSVSRCVALAHDRLEESKIKSDDLRGILLVGGPTRTPYLRARLTQTFGVPLLHDRDPMTVVSEGAAIHASTLLLAEVGAWRPRRQSGEAEIELHYDPVVQERSTVVSGKVVVPESFVGEVRIRSAQGDIDTGWVPLRDRAFVTDLSVADANATEFRLSLRDSSGTLLQVHPSAFAIRCGVVPARPVTPYSYGVVLQDTEVGWVVRQSVPLPAYGRSSFRVASTIAAGGSERRAVYFVEGLSETASDNTKVGELWIGGTDLKRALREGDEVEVRIRMDESRRLTARVCLPLYDLEWDVELRSLIASAPVEDLRESLNEARETLARVRSEVSEDDEGTFLRAQGDLDRVEAELEGIASADAEAAPRVAKQLADSKPRVRTLARTYEVRAKHRTVLEAIDRATEMADRFGDSVGAASADEMQQQANRALELSDIGGLDAVEKRADRLFWEHYVKTRECWTGLVAYLQERRADATEPEAFHQYLVRAQDCLLREDLEGVRLNGVQAMQYLPDREARENRFWASLLRAA